MPKAKPLSWVDAVKGTSTSTPLPSKQAVIETVRKTPDKKEPESPREPRPAFQNVAHNYATSSTECVRPHQMSSAAVYDGQPSYPEKRVSAQKSFVYEPSLTTLPPQDSSPSHPDYVYGKDKESLFSTGGYSSLSHQAEPSTVGERPTGFAMITEDVSVDKPAAPQYYRDPVWGPPTNESIPVKAEVITPPQQESLEEGIKEPSLEEIGGVASPTIRKPEPKKPTSTVVPGISFRDKLTANLKSSSPKPQAPAKQKTPHSSSSGHAQTKSQSSFVDPTNDPVVQSPRQGNYPGKLISNPRRNELHPGTANRGLPSEEHLLSPMTVPHPPVIYLPPHEMTSHGSIGMMPPAGHGVYPEMPPPVGHPHGGQYGNFGPPTGPPRGPTPDGISSMPPPAPYGSQPHGSFSPVSEGAVREDGGQMEAVGRSGRRFQLNPKAKAFKPVVNTVDGSSGAEQHPTPSYAAPPPVEYDARSSSQPGEIPPPVVPPPPNGSVQPQTPKPTAGPGEGAPPDYGGNPPPPGPRPPFVPPSNVVTPWPSFPGTGVWHSEIPAPRPGTPQANAMVNGFIPPGMPSPYPMFVPGMPPPFMGGMQEPMWRPHPMPPGMPDQQRIAMMWGNYYSQLVPPNQRVWNPSKFSGAAGPMPRQGRNNRRPPNGSSNNPPPPSNFSGQTPATQPSGEIP